MYLLTQGYRFVKKSDADAPVWRTLGWLLVLIAGMLVFGVFVQVVGAVLFVIALVAISLKRRKLPEINETVAFYALFALVALSLVLLGSGPYAFDLPL